MIKGKNIVFGICGGISVYKVVHSVSELYKLGANVTVIMTEHARKFVSETTFRSISHNQVYVDTFNDNNALEISHIQLARDSDLIVIAPATANIIGKIACGIADDMLSTTVIAKNGKVLLFPAMNMEMYNNSIVKENMKKLKEHDYYLKEPDYGRMACGDIGIGRLPDTGVIIDEIKRVLSL